MEYILPKQNYLAQLQKATESCTDAFIYQMKKLKMS